MLAPALWATSQGHFAGSMSFVGAHRKSPSGPPLVGARDETTTPTKGRQSRARVRHSDP